MSRFRQLRAIVLALMLGVIVAAPVARADFPTLYVKYNVADCTFRMTNDAGATVTTIAPGVYQVAISTPDPFGVFDLSGRNDLMACKGFVNFRMTGPGVSFTTTLDYGDGAYEQYSATFQPGATYTVQDDVNVAGTRRTFTVATSGSAPQVEGPSSGTSKKGTTIAVLPLRGSLEAVVSSTGKLSLTKKGKKVTSLKSGRYTFAVHDVSKSRGFSIQVVNGKQQSITAPAFVGWRDLTVALEPGRWSFFSPGGAKTTFSVVS